MIKTIEQAYQFVKKVKICTIFESDKVEYPSLWEQVDFPDKQLGEKGWGEKMTAVWTWKTQLPAQYPNEIFYGKIKGGVAALMEMNYLTHDHFPQAHKDIQTHDQLAQHIYSKVVIEPWDTTSLRKATIQEVGCTKSQFDTALKNLQITMNIARLNDAQIERDTWVSFKEQYLDIWKKYENR
ncbi:AlkZ-related protein [Gracilimonas mengyeensis]|uniref:Uncharacterized protein n=1 Tax=Gracilimonas mengyeensis TaxID=1302730 RepID=A0A521DX21_9BACT|nr:hypothetical protein [Gracilimonas mengyeensis]SMO76148.1 hypothetical protein SAMN06265219_109183 [Gracilimonas mengyeensis]